jgi:hypothetical protein
MLHAPGLDPLDQAVEISQLIRRLPAQDPQDSDRAKRTRDDG